MQLQYLSVMRKNGFRTKFDHSRSQHRSQLLAVVLHLAKRLSEPLSAVANEEHFLHARIGLLVPSHIALGSILGALSKVKHWWSKETIYI